MVLRSPNSLSEVETNERESFLATRLRWLGEVGQSDLRSILLLSQAQASRTMADFVQRFGRAILDAAPRLRRYRIRTDVSPPRGPSDPRGLIALVVGQSRAASACRDLTCWFPDVPVDHLDDCLSPPIQDDGFSALIAAIAMKRVVRVDYHSRNRTSAYTLSPHRLVANGTRLYIRAWNHDRQSCETFALPRIRSVRPVPDIPHVGREVDGEMRSVALRFAINRAIGPELSEMLGDEWNMGDRDYVEVRTMKAFERLVVAEFTRRRKAGDADDAPYLPFWTLLK